MGGPPSSSVSGKCSSSPPQNRSQFSQSKQSPASEGSSGPENSSKSAEWLSLDATEPFPSGLFRVPIPDVVFTKMPEMSDSALRCLLALLHLSFRFDPEESEWVRPERQFSRSDIEEATGLSSQGTRNGLDELQSIGWMEVDRSGRSHQYQLLLDVPDQRFTYVPTALLEQAADVGSGTDLRVVLAVLRRTWGWTSHTTDPQSGEQETVHDRWAQLSNRELASATGRSQTAAGQAAQALQGEWIERVRPGNGAYQYRFLLERIQDYLSDRPEEESSFSGDTPNDLSPHRQNSGTPSFNKESFSRDKQENQNKNTGDTHSKESSRNEADAVLTDNSSKQTVASEETRQTSSSSTKTPPPDFTGLSPEKRDLAEKLSNVGIWAGRIAEVLSRFSTGRIRANFYLYRRRSAEQAIRKPGAWLYKAITDGYALLDSNADKPKGSEPAAPGSLPPLEHKDTVSEAKKDAYVTQGTSEEQFHRCPSGRGGLDERQFMYFDPEIGGPTRRV